MNYPMKDGRIDQEFLEKVHEKADNTFFSEVEDVLKAAQEVMQQIQPKHDFEIGDRVKHNSHKDLGVGKVIRVSKSGKSADVEWPEAKGDFRSYFGIYKGTFRVENLTKIKEAQHGEG